VWEGRCKNLEIPSGNLGSIVPGKYVKFIAEIRT